MHFDNVHNTKLKDMIKSVQEGFYHDRVIISHSTSSRTGTTTIIRLTPIYRSNIFYLLLMYYFD